MNCWHCWQSDCNALRKLQLDHIRGTCRANHYSCDNLSIEVPTWHTVAMTCTYSAFTVHLAIVNSCTLKSVNLKHTDILSSYKAHDIDEHVQLDQFSRVSLKLDVHDS